MSLATDADESEASVAFDSLPDNIRESIRAEAPDLVDQGRIPISRLRNPEDIFEIPPLPLTVVNFRIVGVYLGSVPGWPPDKNTTGDVQVLVFDNDPTVKDVVNAVEREANQGNITGVNGFRYDVKTMSNGSQIFDRVEVDYTSLRSLRAATRPAPTSSNSSSTRIHSECSSTTSMTLSRAAGRPTQCGVRTPITALSGSIASRPTASTTGIMWCGGSSLSGPSRTHQWAKTATTIGSQRHRAAG